MNWRLLLNSPKERRGTIVTGQRNEDCGGVRGQRIELYVDGIVRSIKEQI